MHLCTWFRNIPTFNCIQQRIYINLQKNDPFKNIKCRQYGKPGMDLICAKETDTIICANTIYTLNGQFDDQKLKHDGLLIQTI